MASSGRYRRPTAAKSTVGTPKILLVDVPPVESNVSVVGDDVAKDPEIAPLDQNGVEVVTSTTRVPPGDLFYPD